MYLSMPIYTIVPIVLYLSGLFVGLLLLLYYYYDAYDNRMSGRRALLLQSCETNYEDHARTIDSDTN